MKDRRGLSLIETIVYITIFAIISVLAVNSLVMVMKSFNQGRLWSRICASAETATERMTREIRLAYDIDLGLSTLNFHPGHLFLNTYDVSGAPTTIDFYLDNGILMVSEGGGAAVALTSSQVEVTNLVFRPISAPSTSKAIKIELEIRGTQGNYQKTERFYNTAILRGSY